MKVESLLLVVFVILCNFSNGKKVDEAPGIQLRVPSKFLDLVKEEFFI